MSEYAASYKEQIVCDYSGNPLIEALPPIWSSDEVVDMLSHNEGHHDGERRLDAQYRMHCVRRLFRYFQPLEQHVDIEHRFSICIRQGYLHRSPLLPEYAKALTQGRNAIVSQKDYTQLNAFRPTAAGFTIIGLSGVGKTSAVTNILGLYPQIIDHAAYRGTPLMLRQIVWLKLDCPHDGSVKGLCLEFFEAVDRVVGTNYFEDYSRARHTVDVLMIRMTQAARLHCLGVLVIDEIQHLSMAKGGGQEKMLNFFVTLVNTIGVPVVLIGTSRAKVILQSDFRQARRGSGQGDLIWDRMKNDAAWDIFVSAMWQNQWTRQSVRLTDAYKNALYDESQGIIDIAVKLYAMVQVRAIALGKEAFVPSDFHSIASERLGLVKPMLDALRSGDRKKIDMYGDIAPVSIEDYYSAYAAALEVNNVPRKRNEISLSEKAVLKLLELGVEPPKAKHLVGKVLAENQDIRNVAEAVRIAYRTVLTEAEPNVIDEHRQDDLRNAVGYADMKANGMIETEEW
ncbi:MAG: ATP-binding protein [Bacteroidales bacterium]|jgi:hypothetical protein|nr:ATP-binding protein [Bacteroidales bacterium]